MAPPLITPPSASDREYDRLIDSIILQRVRIISGAGAPMIGLGGFMDHAAYPEHAPLFLKFRLAVCVGLLLICALTFWGQAKRVSVYFFASIAWLVAGMIALMIHLTDGSSSLYYQGLSMVIFACAIVNSFRLWSNFWICAVICLMYTAAVFNGHPWNWSNFTLAEYFLVSNTVLVLIMTRLYGAQHLLSFRTNQKLAQLYSEADTLAKLDDLTQIYNRRHFLELLNVKIRSCEGSKTTFFIVFFDIDNFKQINDIHGHAFGDTVIRSVVDRVRSYIRGSSQMGRYGGDEFVFFMDTPDIDSFMNRMRSLRDGVKDMRLEQAGKSIPVSLSFGAVRVTPGRYKDAVELTDAADRAMLSVKQSGKGGMYLLDS